MLGYILSDTPGIWHTWLVKAIDKKKSMLRLISSQQDIVVIKAFPLEWVSEHGRESSDIPIKIYHILLDCTT